MKNKTDNDAKRESNEYSNPKLTLTPLFDHCMSPLKIFATL